jgi:hypothetical protein
MDQRGKEALDECNGHSDESRGYHYHVTPGKFPYITGGYFGEPERSNNHEFDRTRSGAIVDNSQGKSSQGAQIAQVTPASASRGSTCSMRIKLRPGAVPKAAPSWVQIGPFEATKISRRGDLVRFDLEISKDAAVGVPLDCHVEFPGRFGDDSPVVIKKNDVFRVAE